MRWFYSIWLLFSTVSAASALLIAGHFYRARATFGSADRFAQFLIMAFVGVGVEALVSRLPFDPWVRFVGQAIEMATVGALACFCYRLMNGKNKSDA